MTSPNKIFLAGFMGTGKTAVGRILAKNLNYEFFDSDHWIERTSGSSIPEIFAGEGERSFRRWESKALQELIKKDRVVAALGGGTVCFSGNLQKLSRHGLLILLEASLEQSLRRSQKEGGRPLLSGPEPEKAAQRLWERRKGHYARIPWRFSTDGTSPTQVARRIQRQIPLLAGALRVGLGDRAYPIYFQREGLRFINDLLERHCPGDKAVLVTNRTLDRHYGRSWVREIAKSFRVKKIVLPDGEAYKNLKTVRGLYRDLVSFGADRRTPLVALGGGVIGDLVGYAAATYLRGIPFVQIPTTLLAQVDSSIGGKTGVDLPEGKNLVGAFYQPSFVLIDESFLKTLPPRQWASGMAEVIKYGAIFDAKLFRNLEHGMGRYLAQRGRGLEDVLRRCCEWKAWVVEEDELETKGLRSQLNFGHTLGHAVEAVTRYRRYTHGEAIAMGMVFAAGLSVRRAGLSPSAPKRLEALLELTGLPTQFPDLPRRGLRKAMEQDKKRVSGKINFVYLSKIGRAVVIPTPVAEIL